MRVLGYVRCFSKRGSDGHKVLEYPFVATQEREKWGQNDPDYLRFFENNQRWVESMTREDPKYFKKLGEMPQRPSTLCIGCSDSRVPVERVLGTSPGEMFVHRNIANMVVSTDFNLMSVVNFAVDVLGVQRIVVLGHYGCGGIRCVIVAVS